MSDDSVSIGPALGEESGRSLLVVRSAVQPKRQYRDYKDELRWDFFYSCAYCNTMEFEAQGFRFTIDHYLPRSSHPELISNYTNLMWCCEDCNSFKGDRHVPAEVAEAGYRFFKADIDDYFEHFTADGIVVRSKSNIGEYTAMLLNLNRGKLLKIRQMRIDAKLAAAAVVAGVNSLRRLPLDQIPARNRGEVLARRNRAVEATASVQGQIDELLRNFAHSELIDRPEADLQTQKGRRDLQERLGAMFPGRHRGR